MRKEAVAVLDVHADRYEGFHDLSPHVSQGWGIHERNVGDLPLILLRGGGCEVNIQLARFEGCLLSRRRSLVTTTRLHLACHRRVSRSTPSAVTGASSSTR